MTKKKHLETKMLARLNSPPKFYMPICKVITRWSETCSPSINVHHEYMWHIYVSLTCDCLKETSHKARQTKTMYCLWVFSLTNDLPILSKKADKNLDSAVNLPRNLEQNFNHIYIQKVCIKDRLMWLYALMAYTLMWLASLSKRFIDLALWCRTITSTHNK